MAQWTRRGIPGPLKLLHRKVKCSTPARDGKRAFIDNVLFCHGGIRNVLSCYPMFSVTFFFFSSFLLAMNSVHMGGFVPVDDGAVGMMR